MIGGAIVVAMGLLVLGWTAEIVGLFIPESELVRRNMTHSTTLLIASAEARAHNNLGSSQHLPGGLCHQCK